MNFPPKKLFFTLLIRAIQYKFPSLSVHVFRHFVLIHWLLYNDKFYAIKYFAAALHDMVHMISRLIKWIWAHNFKVLFSGTERRKEEVSILLAISFPCTWLMEMKLQTQSSNHCFGSQISKISHVHLYSRKRCRELADTDDRFLHS